MLSFAGLFSPQTWTCWRPHTPATHPTTIYYGADDVTQFCSDTAQELAFVSMHESAFALEVHKLR